MVHPDGLRFNGGQISRYRAAISPRWGNCPLASSERRPRAEVAQNDWSQNGQPRCPIWVARAHAGQLHRL